MSARTHRRVVYQGTIPIPSKALCGAPGKRTSDDSQVTCLACRKRMPTSQPETKGQ